MKGVILVSGGLDSCVTAAMAKEEQGQIAFLHANYGQRTEKRELLAFNNIADFYDVEKRLVVSLDYLKTIGGSSLTDPLMEVPEGDVSSRGDPCTRIKRKGIPSTYVPFRNAQLLSIAVSWAEVIGANSIYIGAVEEDSSGYPDCRKEFFNAFENVINTGTKPSTNIKIHTPLIRMTKTDIVRKGIELKAPLHLTWSCYKDEDKACGECDSCLLRLKGFRGAGVTDPIPYRKAGVTPAPEYKNKERFFIS